VYPYILQLVMFGHQHLLTTADENDISNRILLFVEIYTAAVDSRYQHDISGQEQQKHMGNGE